MGESVEFVHQEDETETEDGTPGEVATGDGEVRQAPTLHGVDADVRTDGVEIVGVSQINEAVSTHVQYN